MIYAIHSNEPFCDENYIYEEDDEAAFDAKVARKFYSSSIVVSTEDHAQELKGLDYIQTPSGLFLASNSFLGVLSKVGIHLQKQKSSFILKGRTERLNLTFWQIIADEAPITVEEVDPVRYWPKFKSFKQWHFVLKNNAQSRIWLGSDVRVPFLMCSLELKEHVVDAGLNLKLLDTPNL